MRNIEVDDEVYEYLENRIAGFSDSPNSVLRRVFRLDLPSSYEKPSSTGIKTRTPTTKAPKADLRKLVAAGELCEGQVLELRDYKGVPQGISAKIRDGQLEYQGRFWSLSALARKLMQELGYQSDAYRGPHFWYNSEGKSVRELWEKWLTSRIN